MYAQQCVQLRITNNPNPIRKHVHHEHDVVCHSVLYKRVENDTLQSVSFFSFWLLSGSNRRRVDSHSFKSGGQYVSVVTFELPYSCGLVFILKIQLPACGLARWQQCV